MKRLAFVLACLTACTSPGRPPPAPVRGSEGPDFEVVLPAPPAPAACPTPGRWLGGPYFDVARGRHRAALLPGNRVMLVGGRVNIHANDDAGMEVIGLDGHHTRYNKVARRVGHSVTRLRDGRVLIIGGTDADAPFDNQPTSLYDPRVNAWTFPSALENAPAYHTATLLDDGRVLLIGGRRNGFPVSPAEKEVVLFDVVRARHHVLAPLRRARAEHTATLLGDGRVLVVGGWGKTGLLGHAELFDPRGNQWTEIAGAAPRAGHTATVLDDGRVLLVGGGQGNPSTQLFDPRTLTFEELTPLLPDREDHTATMLVDGVLIAGGWIHERGATGEAALFDPASRSWCSVASMSHARMVHSATRLADGGVLIAGGADLAEGEHSPDPFVRTTEIFRIGQGLAP